MKKIAFTSLMALASINLSYSQNQFADVIIDAFYSGANPIFNDFYGVFGSCEMFLLDPSVCLGNNDTLVSLPTGSYITVGFTDNIIINAPDQADLFIEELGAAAEFAEVHVSSDFGVNFTPLAIINGGITNAIDLELVDFDDPVNAVKIIGLDNGGCTPGFDVVRVYGIEDANCGAIAETDLPPNLYINTGLFDLNILLDGNFSGEWSGEHVIDHYFNTDSVSGVFQVLYIVQDENPLCPPDTAFVDITVIDGVPESDCAGVIYGSAIYDDCGVCLLPDDPSFNQSCLDCAGIINGQSVLDTCGICLSPIDPGFNQSCYVPPIYIPNAFSPNDDGINDRFKIYSTKRDLTIKKYLIFNRWGQQVYQANDFSLENNDIWWNGRTSTENLPIGVYVYLIEVELSPGNLKTYSGDVLLISNR